MWHRWLRLGDKPVVLLLIAVVIVSCRSQGQNVVLVAASGGTSDLTDRLTTEAYAVLNQAHVRVTNDAEESLEAFIARGAEMVDDAEERQLAIQNIRRFAEELVSRAIFDEVGGGKKVDFSVFQAALSICPLYPFC